MSPAACPGPRGFAAVQEQHVDGKEPPTGLTRAHDSGGHRSRRYHRADLWYQRVATGSGRVAHQASYPAFRTTSGRGRAEAAQARHHQHRTTNRTRRRQGTAGCVIIATPTTSTYLRLGTTALVLDLIEKEGPAHAIDLTDLALAARYMRCTPSHDPSRSREATPLAAGREQPVLRSLDQWLSWWIAARPGPQ